MGWFLRGALGILRIALPLLLARTTAALEMVLIQLANGCICSVVRADEWPNHLNWKVTPWFTDEPADPLGSRRPIGLLRRLPRATNSTVPSWVSFQTSEITLKK